MRRADLSKVKRVGVIVYLAVIANCSSKRIIKSDIYVYLS